MGGELGQTAQGEAQPEGRPSPGRRPQVLREPVVDPLDGYSMERASLVVPGQEHRPPVACAADTDKTLLDLRRVFLAQLTRQQQIRWYECLLGARFTAAKKRTLWSGKTSAAKERSSWHCRWQGYSERSFHGVGFPVGDETRREPTFETIVVRCEDPGRPCKRSVQITAGLG